MAGLFGHCPGPFLARRRHRYDRLAFFEGAWVENHERAGDSVQSHAVARYPRSSDEYVLARIDS